jgi:hypothetical protein
MAGSTAQRFRADRPSFLRFYLSRFVGNYLTFVGYFVCTGAFTAQFTGKDIKREEEPPRDCAGSFLTLFRPHRFF